MNLIQVRVYSGFLSKASCRHRGGVFAGAIADVGDSVSVYVVHEEVCEVFFYSLSS